MGQRGFPRRHIRTCPVRSPLGETRIDLRGDTVENHNIPLANLALSPRTLNALWRGNVTQVVQVLELSDEELLAIRNFSEKCLIELDRKLAERNLKRLR